MTTRLNGHRTLLAIAGGVTMLALVAGGCGSGRNYTTGEKTRAREAQSAIKAATDYDMANQSFVAGDLKKARTLIDSSIGQNDQVVKSWVLKGRIETESENFESAFEAFVKAESLDPEHAEAYYFHGLAFERISDEEQALNQFLTACEFDASNGAYVVAAAETFVALGRVDEAEEFINERYERLQHNPGINQTLGHISMIKNDFPAAIDFFSEAHVLAPDDGAILEDLAQAQVTAGQFAEAEYNLARLLETKGYENRRDLLHSRARCLVELDRPVEARELLIQLTSGKEGGSDTEAWIELGHVSYVLGDYNRVKLSASRVIAQAPQRYEGFMLRAMWQRIEGDSSGAIQSLEKACAFRGPESAPLILLGIVAQQSGELSKAQHAFAEAAQENPQDTTAKQLLAIVEAQIENSFANAPEEPEEN